MLNVLLLFVYSVLLVISGTFGILSYQSGAYVDAGLMAVVAAVGVYGILEALND